MKVFLTVILLAVSNLASGSTTDCKDLYVGRIWIEKGVGLKAVVYLNNRDESGGSYWSYFNGWSPEDKKAVLSLLLAAKTAGHRVNVATENTDTCGLEAAATQTKTVVLTTNP